jgi:DNA topoisomerase-1
MKLVIVESPAKAKTINKYLGKDFKVLASFGHIRDLPAKDGSVRPDENFAMDYEISSKATKHVKEIADAAKGAEIIYLASDPDREGEAISWHVIEVLKQKKAIKKGTQIFRVAFNEITKKAVTHAIENPRDIDMHLVNSQQARRALDYLVGFTLSPVLWRKLPGSKSAGRVQSVALRLICEREEEIEAFKSREYWDIKLDLKTALNADLTVKLTHYNGKKLEQFDIIKESQAGDIVKLLASKNYSVASIEKKQSMRNPYAPFTTSTLQQEASRKLGFGAKKTMQVAQKLYEGVDLGGESVGLITYMRTDGVTVSQDAITATRGMIARNFGNQYLPEKQRFYTTKAKNAQEAHEAVRPTDVNKLPKDLRTYLDEDQMKLYDLIWKRMVASQMSSAILDQVGVDVKAHDNSALARATGSTIKFDGFFKVYRESRDDDKEDEESRILPKVDEGEKLALEKVNPEQHFTQAPPRFTEASLVKKLEELGIGRPSTYASIISVLQERDYVILDKKRFVAADRGRLVTAYLRAFFKRYVEYDFTANLEEQLDHVSSGEMDWKTLLANFWGDFHANIDEAKECTITEVITQLNDILANYLFPKDENGDPSRKCPSCETGEVSLKLGKFGSFLGCSNYPTCKYTKQLGNAEGESEGAEGGSNFDVFEAKSLGSDPATNLDITLKKGPYGFYVQLGGDVKAEPKTKGKAKEKTAKPKRAALPKGRTPDDMDLETAISLLSLPRLVGIHPETKAEITASIGKFGPYLKHDGKFVSLKGDDDVLTIGINRAVTVIAEGATKGGKGRSAAAPLRVIGKHPKTGEDVALYKGQYGPYVKHGKTNASLKKGMSAETLTLDEAVELIKMRDEK